MNFEQYRTEAYDLWGRGKISSATLKWLLMPTVIEEYSKSDYSCIYEFLYNDACKRSQAWYDKWNLVRTECMAWRHCPPEHFSKVWSDPQMGGGHRSPYRQAIIDAMEATDKDKGLYS